MRILDRYLLRELLIPLGYCLGGFLIFWIAFDLFSNLSEFQLGIQERRIVLFDVVKYYVAIIPQLLVTVVPVAMLLALLYALTNHARHQELTAMRAAGVGLWRLCVPYLAVGLTFSLLLFACDELWVPRGAAFAERMREQTKSGRAPGRPDGAEREWEKNLRFQNPRDRRFWTATAYNLKTFELKDPQIDWQLPTGARRVFAAERAVFTNQSWLFFEVTQYDYASRTNDLPEVSHTNLLTADDWIETPDLIRTEIRVSGLTGVKAARRPRLAVAEILNYLKLHPSLDPQQTALLYTQLHGRLAEPWTCFVVVLIAIPFGAPSGRRNVFVGVAGSIAICFAYFIIERFSLALGTGAYISPWLAGWGPNLAFGALGVWLTGRVL